MSAKDCRHSRNCHWIESIDPHEQSFVAQVMHKTIENVALWIDGHGGVAHKSANEAATWRIFERDYARMADSHAGVSSLPRQALWNFSNNGCRSNGRSASCEDAVWECRVP